MPRGDPGGINGSGIIFQPQPRIWSNVLGLPLPVATSFGRFLLLLAMADLASGRRRQPHVHGLTPACAGVCALLCACADMPVSPVAPPQSFAPSAATRAPLEIGVLIAGWHSGILLPAGELGPLARLLRADSHAKYVSFGWGNRHFYMAAQPGSGDALAALFRSPGVLFVQAMSSPGDSSGDARIHWVCVNRTELWRVDSYIEQSLSRARHEPVDLGPGPLPDSRFYASAGHYSAVHTCNTWTIAALQYARLPVRATGVIFAGQAARRTGALRVCARHLRAP